MTRIRRIYVVCFYACVTAAFLTYNWSAGDQPGLVRWPEAVWKSAPDMARAGLDQERLVRSVQRLPAIRSLRMLGNNLRIALGQRLEWIIWGEQESVPVLAAKIELPISTGLTQESLKANLDRLIVRLGQYSAKLQAEGWELYVVPIPTKLGIYREDFSWPLLDADPLSRKPVDADRSDELFGYLDKKLTAKGVRLVNLQTLFRRERSLRHDQWLYPPGESHWSGHGIETAARFTAGQIGEKSHLRIVDQPDPQPMPYRHVGDIVRSLDAFPQFLGRYGSIYNFDETLKRWPVYDPAAGDHSAVLLAVLGTSYTGQYAWLTDTPVGFAQALGAHLKQAKVYQISQTGIGGFHPFRIFLERKEDIAREFSQQIGRPGGEVRKVVVWEFPIRDFGYLTAETGAKITRISNPNGLEVHREKQLFWMNDAPTLLDIFATDDGIVTLQAEFYPGPGRHSQNDRTLVIRNEAGSESAVHISYGLQVIRYPVKAGLNRLFWEVKEKSDTPPPAGGDPRILLLSVFDLQLTYQAGTEN